MTASYDRINYSLRPAKYIERRMIAVALQRLDRVAALDHYRYVGFGSPYFSDFALFHRAWGVRTMTTIEREVSDIDRIEFNRPYGCIEVKPGESTEVLPTLDWQQRTIVWLDYDDPFSHAAMADIQLVLSELAPLSVLLVSVNAEPGPMDERISQLHERLGDFLPVTIKDPDLLGGWRTADLYRQVFSEQVSTVLDDRNVGLSSHAQLSFQQLFYFQYRDGARMATFGGILYDAGLSAQVASCDFDSFPFVSRTDSPYVISVPNLTWRELRYLDQQLPSSSVLPIDAPFLPAASVAEYVELYRYFPRFVDAEV